MDYYFVVLSIKKLKKPKIFDTWDEADNYINNIIKNKSEYGDYIIQQKIKNDS